MSVNEFIKNASKRVAKRQEVKEIDIEKEFCTYAKSLHCVALKLIILNRKGFPDRTVLCPGGIVFFIEFKKKNKPRTPIQTKVMKMIKRLGFKYYTCDAIGQAEKILDKHLKGV